MRSPLAVIAAAAFAAAAMSAAFAQVRPPFAPPPAVRPIAGSRPIVAPPLVMPTLRPRGMPTAAPSPSGAVPQIRGVNSVLGPKIPLSMLPKLPRKTAFNTARNGIPRHRMSGTITSIMYDTVSGCSSTLGYIYNVGCQIEFQLAYCNGNNNNSAANCGNYITDSITPTDYFQDYYIDANTGTAQTIGSAYQPSTETVPSDCSSQGWAASQCPYGPFETLTLNNAGTVVLATLDCGASASGCSSSSAWVATVYLTVGGANGMITYSDTQRKSPQTQFSIPTGGTNTVYITLDSAQYSDTYVIYIENTSTYTTCEGTIGQTDTGPSTGLCNPVGVAGTKALSSGPLYMQWTFGSGTLWTALSTGTYSLVAYDQTQGKRVAQTQVSLVASGAVTTSTKPIAGNASPAPAPAATPGTRFAFDNTTDESDSGFTTTWSGLNTADTYCITLTDPEGRVYQDYVTPTLKYACLQPPSSTYSVSHTNINAESPVDFAPNTYTIQLCNYNLPAGNGAPCTVVASEAIQLLGYNVLSEFTNAAGTSVIGTSLVVPKNSTTAGGLEFVNDGDSYYGTGNGDTLSALYYSTANNGATGDGSTLNLSCGTSCTQTVTDSNGQSWYVRELQHGGGANAYTTLEICPTAWGTSCATNTGTQSLAMNASIVIPNITFIPPPGSSNCTGGNCQGPTSVLPQDGLRWSTIGSSVSSNLTYFTNSNFNTYGGTGTFTHLGVTSGCGASCSAFSGTVTSPCTVSPGGNAEKNQQGFYSNFEQGMYSIAEPFSPASAQGDVYCVQVTNNSSTGTITGISFKLPSGYASGSYSTTWSVDANSPTTWTKDTTSGKCPSGVNFCIKPNGSNAGIAIGASQIIYLDVQNLPPLSFSFADVSETVYNPVSYALTADACCTQTIPVSATAPSQSTIDSLALGAYSLDASYMTPLFNPTSEGTSTNNTVNISLKNTSISQDTNPDYVDAVVVEFSSTGILGTPSTLSPSSWIYLGSNSPGIGGGSTIDYWFGVCSAQYSTANGPQSNPTSSNAKSLPPINGSGCSSTAEQNALSPGSTFSFDATVQTGASAGTIPATMYAHGANGNGWSKGHNFSLTVTSVSATAGFSKAGTYGSPATVPSNTTPQIGPDTNTTNGNSFVYTISNTSGAGHNLNSAQILIPYQDASGADGSDSSGFIWKITSAPTVTGGSGYSNCAVTSYTNPTAGSTNGYITIGNSGGTCTISPNGYIDISFPMQAPYKANDQYEFPTCVNGTFTVSTCGAVTASETWVGDTYIQTVLGASLVITVDATTNVKGNPLSPTCITCTYTQPTNTIDFGSGLAGGSTTPGTDVALVDLYTNATSPIGWSLYVTQSATDTTAAPYLQSAVDNSATKSYQPVTGTTLDQTAYASIPVTASYASGLLLANSSSGTSATRSPFEFSNDYRIVIPAVSPDLGPNTSTVTYTFISN